MEKKWWHGKIAYQIYPKSFADSNGDGIGDLKGIIAKLPYLKELGVDIIWLSPIYPSPFADQGYDISDYTAILPLFGSMADFDELLCRAKALGLDIIMDLVANHCSNEHEWFKRACADPESEEASYFYFRKGHDGHEPDNLRAYFGGSVWDKVPGHEDEDLYYLHYFTKEQPDLNWSNPKLRDEIYKLVNFWLDKGVRGFRIDAIMCICKDLNFPGLPADDIDGRAAAAMMNAKMADKIGPYLRELKERTFKKYDAFTVGEAAYVNPATYGDFVGDDGYFSTLFDLSCREVIEADNNYCDYKLLGVKGFKECVFKMQESFNDAGFIAPIIENHDEPRGVSYFLPKKYHNAAGAKALGTVQVLLRGIPFIYQGQELGMTNTRFDAIDEFDDVFARQEYQKSLDRGCTPAEALSFCALHGRDNARTPMLWNDSANAGFSTGKPWLKVHQDYKTLNAALQEQDGNSVLNYYRRLIALRKDPRYLEIFTYGRFERIETSDNTIAYRRTLEGRTITVAANFEEDAPLTLNFGRTQQCLLASGDYTLNGTELILPAGSAIVLIG